MNSFNFIVSSTSTCGEKFVNLIKIVEDKINKWKKFQKTDEKAIGIILNNSVPDIYIFEISLKFSKFNNEIDYFFIL
ncbi:hypothetical protein [Spiroplasma ixodetis]|uniref:hypothetical protein n=1 Tax=Spiroplasma ixodetis TaxID=2141 RepID=UPI002490B1E1|nr:hypothetical protein [Spiroplasma ixodetis]